MLKQLITTVLVAAFAGSAFAQDEKSPAVRMKRPDLQRSQFDDYVMKGFSGGLEYASYDGDLHLKLTSKTTGVVSTTSDSTSKSSSAIGASGSYGRVRRGGVGFIAGMAVLKILDSDKNADSVGSIADDIVQLRPEGNFAFALRNGMYGSVGGHLSYLSMNQDTIDKLGVGIQTSIGYIPTRNVGFDIGFHMTRHSFNIASTSAYDIDKAESYIYLKQLRARVTYMF